MLEDLKGKIEKIIEEKKYLDKNAAIGFDGFVDKIYRPISSQEGKTINYYKTIDDFGDRIKQASGLSCDIDIELESIQPGGNTPLFANSLGHLGINTDCISPIDEYEEIFNKYMSKNCNIYSIGKPALSFVLEFFDGKIMLGDTHTFKEIDYNTIKNKVGDKIYEILNNYELLSMVNWSHFNNMTSIWKKIINYLNQNQDKFNNKEQTLFIDLADTSSRSIKDIKEMLKTLSDFRDYYRVIIGLNENEVRDLGKKMMTNNFKDITNIGKHLVNSGFVDEVVIHPVAEAYLVKKSNKVKVRVPKVEAPVLTVGGGDNFNAGFIWGILNNLTDQESLVLGTVNARLFVEKGSSPSIDDLYNYISKNKDSIEVINI
ncbi:hypothetical protein HSACCH_00982 [Halanaerobium saccharolyticum subsp. saccharolyticum DSM 6643]|uniref:Uncharacterized protein n=1 Tax=Halanaerobium saccharolyticum subsp. saccharolyticum DSM 6643 TaxID=1293054 RepID=M5DZ48_9FIRM|nr:PfkB family carbohydrate kinase [Halanaerobium saccharolyticum]CCU78916.1 hypothetical protein HSACCH_00982 [Halanaerobium saccharolyticum subsp. saccharolyticum DSM 6643]